MNTPVVQTVAGWDDWPDDVRETLHRWNRLFLLSFVRTGDFTCNGCGRRIAGHPNGNALLRARRKARGDLRCEDCLTTLARRHDMPPAWFSPKRRPLEQRLRDRIAALDGKRVRLREQIASDQVYIDALEQLIPTETLQAVRDRLRGTRRRPC